MLLFLRGSAWLRPETPDLTIRLVLQDRVLTATTRRTLSDTALVLVLQSQFGWGRLPAFRSRGRGDMAQAVRRSAWPSGEVEQAEKQAGYGQTGWSSCTSASVDGSGGWSRAVARWPTCEGC